MVGRRGLDASTTTSYNKQPTLFSPKITLTGLSPFPSLGGRRITWNNTHTLTWEQCIVSMCAWDRNRLQVARTLDTEPLEQPRNLVHPKAEHLVIEFLWVPADTFECQVCNCSARSRNQSHTRSVQHRAVELLLGTSVHHISFAYHRSFIVRFLPQGRVYPTDENKVPCYYLYNSASIMG